MTSRPVPERPEESTPAREWDAASYHTLSEPQFAWGQKVLATLALDGSETVLDAGAGTGRLTALLAQRLPRGRVVALDRSVNMAMAARETLAPAGDRTAVVAGDLTDLPFGAFFDVVFSTATFHWVLDHDRLFAALAAVLRAGGRLHAQCGGAGNLHRIHERAHALMHSPEFSRHFTEWRRPWEFASAEVTRERLERAGFVEVVTNIEDAPAVFADAAAFRAFITTVVMRPFLARLPDDATRSAFLDGIVAAAALDDPPFMLDYRRLNISTRKG